MKIRSFFKKNYLSFIFGLISIIVLYFISLYSYLLYHSFAELFSIIIAFGIFIIAWNSKKFLDNNYLLFVGIAYLFVALLDLFHTLAYEGIGIFTGFAESNLATQLWISARYLESISLFLALFFITRRLNYKLQFICYLMVTTLILLSIFYWKIFPAAFIEGSGLTTFKIVSEYIISFILAAAIFFLYLYRKEFSRPVFMLIIASLVITILSELSFTLYTDVYGFFNQLGHFFKLISFFLIYKAIIETGFSQPFDLLFFKLKQSEKDIKESEEKFHSLYSYMNEGVALHEIVYDKTKKPVDYKIIDVNNAFQSIFGLGKDKVIGKKASEIYGTGTAPCMDIFTQAVESKKPARFETYFTPLKKYFYISVFFPSKGKFAALFSDITKRKKVEKKMKNLSKFPSENPNPVMRMNDKNLIIYANKPAKKMLQQLRNEKESRFPKILTDLVTNGKNKKITKLETAEIKIGKLIYEINILPVKGANYYNIYGKDITEQKKARRYYYKMVKGKALNEERNKLARELHDTVTQTLFSANLIAEVIPKLLKKDPKVVTQRVEEIRKLNNIALTEMRVLLYELRPSAIKDEDLGNLLQELVKLISARSNIPIEVKINGKYKYPVKIELGYYRIAQEALNNIIKHSCATKATLILESLPKKIYMGITDNGCGFDDKKIASTNLGLTIMRERAKLIGASMNIDSAPGDGTRIKVTYSKKTDYKEQTGPMTS